TRNPDTVLSAINNFKGRKFDYTPMNQFEEQYARYPTEVVEQVRNDVVMTALRGLSTRLGGLREARKSIIFVSEGFQASLPPQMRRADATMPADPRVTGGMLGENSQREQTAEFFSQSDLYSRMRDVFAAATRNNAAAAPTDGKFHENSVRVKRRDVDVRARKGYWAYTIEDLKKSTTPTVEVAKPVQNALASIATSVQAAKYIRTWIGTERAAGGKTRVTLIWEPLPQPVGVAQRRDQPQPGRVSI